MTKAASVRRNRGGEDEEVWRDGARETVRRRRRREMLGRGERVVEARWAAETVTANAGEQER